MTRRLTQVVRSSDLSFYRYLVPTCLSVCLSPSFFLSIYQCIVSLPGRSEFCRFSSNLFIAVGRLSPSVLILFFSSRPFLSFFPLPLPLSLLLVLSVSLPDALSAAFHIPAVQFTHLCLVSSAGDQNWPQRSDVDGVLVVALMLGVLPLCFWRSRLQCCCSHCSVTRSFFSVLLTQENVLATTPTAGS